MAAAISRPRDSAIKRRSISRNNLHLNSPRNAICELCLNTVNWTVRKAPATSRLTQIKVKLNNTNYFYLKESKQLNDRNYLISLRFWFIYSVSSAG